VAERGLTNGELHLTGGGGEGGKEDEEEEDEEREGGQVGSRSAREGFGPSIPSVRAVLEP
jgi:hypothetical protein